MEKTLTQILFSASSDEVKVGQCEARFKIGTATGSVTLILDEEDISAALASAKAKLVAKLEEDGSTVVDATS